MVRRPDTESDKSSQSINERPVKSSSGRMSTTNGRDEDDRTEDQVDELDQEEFEGDAGEDEEDHDRHGSPKGKKRARINDDGESVVVKDEPRPRRPAVLQRDKDG